MTTNDWHISAPDNGQGGPPGAKEGMSDAATTLLASEGGAGAELRGHVPDDPSGVVLILHGGAETSRMPVAWWRLAVLRMVPFASTISGRGR